MDGVSPDATLIVPQYEQTELTVACVESLRAAEATCWPVIVVDDGSSAAAFRALVAAVATIPNVNVLAQQRQGVTAAWNRAAQVATTRFLVFLNNDTVSSGAWVDDLLQPLRAQRAVVSGVRFRREQALPRDMLERLPTQAFLEGWCFAVERDVWRVLGGFDQRMRLYFSDTDFQARVAERNSDGATFLAAVPDLPLHHLGHQSTQRLPERRSLWEEDRERFIRKWGSDFGF